MTFAGRLVTFQHHSELVTEDVEGAVSRAGLWDDVLLEPASTGIVVKVLTGVHFGVHVLNEAGSCKSQRQQRLHGTKMAH